MEKPKVISRRKIHSGWFHVRRDTLRIPGYAKKYPYDVVTIGDGVAVLPFLDEAKVLLARQYRHPVDDSPFELIQGGMQEGETIVQAAQRELLEETGYSAMIEHIGTMYPLPGSLDMRLHLTRARNMKKIKEPIDDPLERMDLVERHYGTVLDEVLSGVHRDSALRDVILFHSLKPF